ncbi:MAG: hypothetical protein OHK0045_10310 [Raineya sp.]
MEQKVAEVAIDIKKKYPVQPIDEEKLKNAWLQLVAYWREQHYNSTEVIILDRKFEWQAPKVVLSLENNLQVEVLEKRKSTWVRLLQEQMQNASNIEICAKIAENQEDKIPYTNAEKWQYLHKKYPAMELLKNKLGLDIE